MTANDAKPRLLDLFCGAGGAAMGYHRAGFEGVHITTDRSLAETYASTVSGPAWVYEVEPQSDPIPVLSLVGGPTISYRCDSARIVRRFTLSNERRSLLRGVVSSEMFE